MKELFDLCNYHPSSVFHPHITARHQELMEHGHAQTKEEQDFLDEYHFIRYKLANLYSHLDVFTFEHKVLDEVEKFLKGGENDNKNY